MKRPSIAQNELMIVNPGSLDNEKTLNLDQLLFGDDGYAYQIQGLEENDLVQGVNEFYLGDDGVLYGLEIPESLGKYVTQEHSLIRRYFLGEDGTLYEVV